MSLSVRYSKQLENHKKPTGREERIRLNHMYGQNSKKLDRLLENLSKRTLSDTVGEQNLNSFQRPPFRPNYETNSVFIFSILQSAISALVNHKGSPFYYGILESRNLCVISCITLLFAVICINGSMPFITNFLGVKPLPSRRSKLVFHGILAMNIIACFFCRFIEDKLLSIGRPSVQSTTTSTEKTMLKNAADCEEKLLLEEAKLNLQGIWMFCGVVLILCWVQ